jgi:hypothetical protein
MSLAKDLELMAPERRAGALLDVAIAARRETHTRPRERPFTNRQALTCLEFEALFVAVSASNIAQGVELTEDDLERLWLASERITTIVEESMR